MAWFGMFFNVTSGDDCEELAGWWHVVNESRLWQDGIFFFLTAAYALVSFVALVQLIRIELRVPEFRWTTQKVFIS